MPSTRESVATDAGVEQVHECNEIRDVAESMSHFMAELEARYTTTCEPELSGGGQASLGTTVGAAAMAHAYLPDMHASTTCLAAASLSQLPHTMNCATAYAKAPERQHIALAAGPASRGVAGSSSNAEFPMPLSMMSLETQTQTSEYGVGTYL